MAHWTDGEVFRLIEVWGDEDLQEQLEGSKRNKHVYERMAESLLVYGIEKSGEQCCTKVKKLRQEYKKIRNDHKQTGNDRKKWKFYGKVNEILGNRPSITPPVVLDTLDSSTSSTERITSEEEARKTEKEAGEFSDDEKEADRAPDKALKCIGNAKENSIKGKKRKRAKAEVMEEVMTKTMKTVTDGFKETEKMMLGLEERQMAFEERMRKQDREFQMDMMKMLVSRLPSPNPSQYPMYQPYQPPQSGGYFNHENM